MKLSSNQVPERAAEQATAPRLPRLKSIHSGGHEYAVVYWANVRHMLGRRDEPDHLKAYRAFCESIRLTGQPPSNEELHRSDYLIADLVADYLEHATNYYRYLATGLPTPTVRKIRGALSSVLAAHYSPQRSGRMRAQPPGDRVFLLGACCGRRTSCRHLRL